MKFKNKLSIFLTSLVFLLGCESYLDVNISPNAVLKAPVNQVMTSATVAVGFTAGSDIHRYTALIAQHFAGQGAAGTQSLEYSKYLIQPSDVNNLWGNINAVTMADLEFLISEGTTLNSPHYTGIAKLLKAYTYHILVDTWGDVPFTEAQQGAVNPAPKYDDDEDIYEAVIALIDEGIADIKSTTSDLKPGANETIYGGNLTKWEKFANTLKLRLFLHYSKKDATFATTQINALINSGAVFMTSTADNFQHAFVDATNNRNPIHEFEIRRQDQFFPHATLVNMMNTKADPRRASYFTEFPWASGNYAGATNGAPLSVDFSRLHTFLRGNRLNTTATVTPTAGGGIPFNSITYTGAAPTRMLTYAEYNFIRAEAAVRFGSPGTAQTFFAEGIRASMVDAGVSTANIDAYLATSAGTLTGTTAEQLKQIIEEKFVANYGVAVEPWTDYRRTGFPILSTVANFHVIDTVPRVLFYPQNEIDANPNTPARTGMTERVFWDAN
jgi:hypothetical protein